MSVLFCHDHRFEVDERGRIYSQGQYDSRVFSRYIDLFGELRLACRVRPVTSDETAGLSACSMPGLSLARVPELSSLGGLLWRNGVERAFARAMADCDAVIARLPSEIGLAALATAHRLGKPAAVEVVACVRDGLNHHGSWKARLYAPIAYHRMRRAVARSSHTLYVTERFLQARYPAYGVAGNGISNVEIAVDDKALDRRLARIAHGATPVLGFIGALRHRQKGLDVAMRALQEVRARHPNVQLRVLGAGNPQPWREEARRMGLEDSMAFDGTLPRGQAVLDWLDHIDIYLHPSYQEGLSRAIIEALSRGCTVLSSAAGGSPEIVGSACLHAPGEAGVLAAQLHRALAQAEWRTALAYENIKTARRFDRQVLDARRNAFWRRFRADSGIASPATCG